MRVLLDECLDRRLATRISNHDVQTVPQAGWAGKKNGELLTLAAQHFDAFVTVDRGIEFQKDLEQFNLIVVLLRAESNRLADMEPLLPELLSALQKANPPELIRVGTL